MSTRLPIPPAEPVDPRMSICPLPLKVVPGTKASAPSRVVTLRWMTSSCRSTSTLAGESSTSSGVRLAVTTIPGSSMLDGVTETSTCAVSPPDTTTSGGSPGA